MKNSLVEYRIARAYKNLHYSNFSCGLWLEWYKIAVEAKGNEGFILYATQHQHNKI